VKPRYISLAQVFGAPVRFVVPLFQRPYVWERKAQWEPLWDDVSTVAERILAADAGATVRGHFLGSVVLEQESTATGSVERRSVIDGQQRLTTIQLLLKAATHAFGAAKQPTPEDGQALARAGQQVASLVINPPYAAGEEAYKVWPTNEDRAPFRSVLDASGPDTVTGTGHIPSAYKFFFEAIGAWLQVSGSPGDRAAALARALMHHLQVIVLDLEATDEPQAIFETLNTGGAPLSPVDLVKNWLLWEAVRAGHDEASCAVLHSTYWKPFDVDAAYWREKVGIGHAARPRVDGFLVNWLTERTLASVVGGHVYETFLDKVAEPARLSAGGHADVPVIMQSIHASAERYRQIDAPGLGRERFTTFLRRLKAMNLVVLHPLLMHLLGRSGSDAEDLNACAVVLESFLIRRLVCDTGTRGYGTLFLNLLIEVAGKGPAVPAAPIISSFLGAGRSNVNVWPDDSTFARYWVSRDAYKGRGARPLMILCALEEEEWRRDHLAMPVANFNWARVQVEHVMPQGWQEHWPLLPGGEVAARDEALQRIGNLTLVSEALNPVLSNGPWSAKRTALAQHAHLRLTTALTAQECWDEATIEARSAKLFELARSIWPKSIGG
jgi:hypothetical protein